MAMHLLPDLAQSTGGVDSAIPGQVALYMPPVLRGFCLAAMMAIMMSTADTALLISGTTFSRDIVRAFRPQSSDKALLRLARIFIISIFLSLILMVVVSLATFKPEKATPRLVDMEE